MNSRAIQTIAALSLIGAILLYLFMTNHATQEFARKLGQLSVQSFELVKKRIARRKTSDGDVEETEKDKNKTYRLTTQVSIVEVHKKQNKTKTICKRKI